MPGVLPDPDHRAPLRVVWATALGGTSGWFRRQAVSTADFAAARGIACGSARIAGLVPSRAADNLFWLGSYLERAEVDAGLLGARDAGANPQGVVNRASSRFTHHGFVVNWGATSQCDAGSAAKSQPRRCRAEEDSARRCRWLRSAQRTATPGGAPFTRSLQFSPR